MNLRARARPAVVSTRQRLQYINVTKRQIDRARSTNSTVASSGTGFN